MITSCPHQGQESCPYFEKRPPSRLKGTQTHGCYANTDHTYPQRLARRPKATALEKAFIYSAGNLVQMCIDEHDEKNRQYDFPYNKFPSVATMIVACTVELEPWEVAMQEPTLEALAA